MTDSESARESGPGLTVEQLQQRFWQIPADRFLPDPAPGTATERHVLDLQSKRGWPPELLDGVLIDRAPGFQGAIVSTTLLHALMTFLDQSDLGIVIGGSKCPIRLGPRTLRLASIYFISWEQMPGGRIPNDAISDLVPWVVGELLSPWCTRAEMARKRDDFLNAGARQFWLLDTNEERVEISTQERTQVLDADEFLDGEDVLPGFSCKVQQLFKRLRPPVS